MRRTLPEMERRNGALTYERITKMPFQSCEYHLMETVKRERELLVKMRKHGWHAKGCSWWTHLVQCGEWDGPCTCGWAEFAGEANDE